MKTTLSQNGLKKLNKLSQEDKVKLHIALFKACKSVDERPFLTENAIVIAKRRASKSVYSKFQIK